MPQRRDPGLDRFLLEGERVVVDVRQHWGVIAGPIAIVTAGLFLVLWVDAHVRLDGGPVAQALWLLWFASVGWLLFEVLQWRHDRFIATDKRLLLDYGVFTTKVAMMPLIKVTDMSFRRSVPGRIFGYGQFVLESAGQDQALRQIDWVPDPDHTYRVICAEIFGVIQDRSAAEDDAVKYGRDRARTGSGVREESFSRPIPVREHEVESPIRRSGASPFPSGEVIYRSDEERRRSREADTGPIVPPPSGE
jgi:membrane protein YdbS with pleckstrin-like domain